MNAELRIGLDYRPALWSRAGIARSVRELVAALDARELDEKAPWRLALYGDCLRRAPAQAGDPPFPRSERIALRARRWPGRLANRWSLMRGARAILGPLDLFHSTDYVDPPFADVPLVATIHDLSFRHDTAYHGGERSERLERVTAKLVAQASFFVTPSQATARDLEHFYGVSPAVVRVIPLGCEHVARLLDGVARQERPSGNPLEILTLGTIEPRKNHLRCLHAIERLVQDGIDARWIVIGKRGWGDAPFFAALERSAIRDRVELRADGVDDRSAFSALRRADIALYPASREGFGLPIVEAFAAGTPVITARGGATEEVAGDAALLVDPTSIEEILDNLRKLAADRDLRRDLACLGRERAERFTWKRAAEAHLAAWREARLLKA